MEIQSNIEIYDSELKGIKRVADEINSKYMGRPDSKQNLLSMVHEAEDKFRKIGLNISVAMSRQIIWAMGTEAGPEAPEHITFSIDSRVNPDFDHDKMAWEAKKGLVREEGAKKFLSQGGSTDQRVKINELPDLPDPLPPE